MTEKDTAADGNTAPDDAGSGDTPPTPDELGFAGALAELDSIVRGLEADTIDVDHLSASVERAAELVEWCRGALGDTRARLDEVLPRLELADDPGDDDAADGVAGDASGDGDGA